MSPPSSRTALIRSTARTDDGAARRLIGELLRDLFGLDAGEVVINHDRYSLNSLNGFFSAGDEALFFKFHQEDGEEAMAGEYYRADLLAEQGLPIDLPLYKSARAGEQILVYRRRSEPRFSEIVRELDGAPDRLSEDRVVAAQTALDQQILAVYLRTLHATSGEEVAAEPIHRLFYERLVDGGAGSALGGRYRQFYLGQDFAFPGVTLPWDDFSRARLRVNGRLYQRTIGELFAAAHARLNPRRLADAGGVVAHGDAHNANVWWIEQGQGARLAFFDPAFAGRHVPALLAEVKATFHNALAHPFWLYDPDIAAERFCASASYDKGTLSLATDWDLTPLRRRLLKLKAETVWRPLLSELAGRGALPADWRDVVRLALFLCPTLVMNLRAGAASHNPASSLIAFAVAIQVGSPPLAGEDFMTEFLAAIDPARTLR